MLLFVFLALFLFFYFNGLRVVAILNYSCALAYLGWGNRLNADGSPNSPAAWKGPDYKVLPKTRFHFWARSFRFAHYRSGTSAIETVVWFIPITILLSVIGFFEVLGAFTPPKDSADQKTNYYNVLGKLYKTLENHDIFMFPGFVAYVTLFFKNDGFSWKTFKTAFKQTEIIREVLSSAAESMSTPSPVEPRRENNITEAP